MAGSRVLLHLPFDQWPAEDQSPDAPLRKREDPAGVELGLEHLDGPPREGEDDRTPFDVRRAVRLNAGVHRI